MAGAGYKLFNTGDVLTAAQVNTYLMEQTVMVFDDAASRTTALTGVVSEGMISYLKDTNAVEVYDGSNWVASDDPNAIQNSIVDAKGDLISATADNTPARLAVGNNGETLVADSSASQGLRWQEPKAGNPLINSSFQVWQRGTSIDTAGGPYTADRWQAAGSNDHTVSRQVTGDTTNLPNIQYCARVQRDSGSTSTGTLYFAQSLETVNSIPFVGKTVTLSFYARRGANYSNSGNAMGVQLAYGTGTDQNVISGFTGQTNVIDSSATLTTTWQRFSFTGTVSTSATQLGLRVYSTGVGTAGAADYYEITGVQLEVGSVATPFKTQGVTLAQELAACQRYYYKSPEMSVVPGAATFSGLVRGGVGASGQRWIGAFALPVTMRTNPTCVVYNPQTGASGSMRNEDAATNLTVSGIFGQYTNTVTQIDFSTSTTANNVVVGYITASAEL